MRNLIIATCFLLAACGFRSKTKVSVEMRYKNHADSVIVMISNYRMKFDSFDFIARKEVAKDSVSVSHDFVYDVKVYSHDTVIAKETFFSNDLGYTPNQINLIITPRLEIVDFFCKSD